ncbi:hypothetical protein [Paenibacillus pasadenensis]|uniref:hypothetical protein n=1 Tax=Paenibacillus pasadenensis TaxID=217090 RepID=UPI000C7C54FF|nr:hypothetical protein [Paenibacillus pasadenensis]
MDPREMLLILQNNGVEAEGFIREAHGIFVFNDRDYNPIMVELLGNKLDVFYKGYSRTIPFN